MNICGSELNIGENNNKMSLLPFLLIICILSFEKTCLLASILIVISSRDS